MLTWLFLCVFLQQEDEPNAGSVHDKDQAEIRKFLVQKYKKLPWKPEVRVSRLSFYFCRFTLDNDSLSLSFDCRQLCKFLMRSSQTFTESLNKHMLAWTIFCNMQFCVTNKLYYCQILISAVISDKIQPTISGLKLKCSLVSKISVCLCLSFYRFELD